MEQVEMVQFLLNAGADIDKKAANGLSPLHFTVLRENAEIAQHLLQSGANLDAIDNANRSATDWAQQKGLSEFETIFNFSAQIESREASNHADTTRYIPRIEALFGRTINSQSQPLDKRPLNVASKQPVQVPISSNFVLETGIKAIDLCMPIKRGGFAGIFTPLSGVGRLMIQAQLMSSVIQNYDGYVIFLGLEQGENSANALKMEWLAELNLSRNVLDEKFILVFEQDDASLATKQRVAETGRAIAEQLWLDGKEVLIVVDESISQVEGSVDYLRRYPTISSAAAITTLFDGDHSIGLEPTHLSGLDTYITL